MKLVMNNIYNRCVNQPLVLTLNHDAVELYENFHDSVVDFRKEDSFEESRLSVKSKSLGLVMRVAGIISLLRSSVLDISKVNVIEIDNFVTGEDFRMASLIVDVSVNTAFSLLRKQVKRSSSKVESKVIKSPLPEPENFSIENAQQHQRLVKKIISQPTIPLSIVSRDKIYPVINGVSGSQVGTKFLRGLQNIGLGQISPVSKTFKRCHPDDENCEDRDELKKKYKRLNLDFTEC